MRRLIKIRCCFGSFVSTYTNIQRHFITYRVTSGVLFSTDQSATSLLIIVVLKTEHRMKADVRLVNNFNCLAYDWTIKDEWNVYVYSLAWPHTGCWYILMYRQKWKSNEHNIMILIRLWYIPITMEILVLANCLLLNSF